MPSSSELAKFILATPGVSRKDFMVLMLHTVVKTAALSRAQDSVCDHQKHTATILGDGLIEVRPHVAYKPIGATTFLGR